MPLQLKNNVSCTLAAPISSTNQTTCTVQAGEGANFADCNGTDWTYATIENLNGTTREIVKVTNRSGDVLTILRGQDDTTPTTFSVGDRIERRVNKGLLTDLIAKHAPAIGPITSSGLTQSTGKILGRTTAGTGAVEEIVPGSGLSLAGGTLSCTVTAPVTSVVGQIGDVTSAQIRDALLAVDGSGSGLDADYLDGYHASAFLTNNWVYVGAWSGYVPGYSEAPAWNLYANYGSGLYMLYTSPSGTRLYTGASSSTPIVATVSGPNGSFVVVSQYNTSVVALNNESYGVTLTITAYKLGG